jgi:diacylglycerol kinase (ATP)
LTKKRALLIVNRAARNGGLDLARIHHAFEAAGFAVTDRSPNDPADIADTIRRHAGAADLLVLGGGDGTISRALPAILEHDLPTGILPLGTANDFARTLAIPEDLGAACAVIAGGCTARVDVGRVNEVPFLNVASLGLSVAAAEELSSGLKKRWGPLAYALSALRARHRVRRFRIRIVWNHHRKRMRCVQLLVGNGRYYGGGLMVSDQGAIDDGALDVYILRPPRLLDLLVLLPALRWGRLRDWAGARRIVARSLTITTREPMPIDTDGEILTETPAAFTVLPRALTVFVPRGGAPGLGNQRGGP